MECDRIDDFIRSTPTPKPSITIEDTMRNETAVERPLCIKCHEKPSHARKMCISCWGRAKRAGEFTPGVGGITNKKESQNGSAHEPAAEKPPRKSRIAKAKESEPESVTYLKERAKAVRDAAYGAADVEYQKAIEAIEIVAALAKP